MHQTQANNTHHSMLKLLRDLIPSRTIGAHEHRRIAELQANHLRRFLDVKAPLLPNAAIVGLPHVKIHTDTELPTSGMSYWNGHSWIVLLNPNEPGSRQRFTLFHELHHIICHTKHSELFGASAARNDPVAEAMADYFAACVLMPKLYVKRLFGRGTHNPHELAPSFGVSTSAMAYRLDQLGLSSPPRRCGRPQSRYRQNTRGRIVS